MIRVVIVDDEALIRSGFSLILAVAGDIEVVATARGGEALATIAEHQPDVVLLDIRMPDIDGLTILRELRRGDRPPVVGILTTFDADEYVAQALSGGAAGFILKDTDPQHLAQFVRALAAGAVVLSPQVTGAVIRPAEEDTVRARQLLTTLTSRETTVLRHIADGLTNAEIGVQMFLSAATVKDHVSVILTKLRVTGRIQAALLAQRAGLLDRPAP